MHNDALRYLLIWTFCVIKVHVECNAVLLCCDINEEMLLKNCVREMMTVAGLRLVAECEWSFSVRFF